LFAYGSVSWPSGIRRGTGRADDRFDRRDQLARWPRNFTCRPRDMPVVCGRRPGSGRPAVAGGAADTGIAHATSSWRDTHGAVAVDLDGDSHLPPPALPAPTAPSPARRTELRTAPRWRLDS